jgi:hypothetical protein
MSLSCVQHRACFAYSAVVQVALLSCSTANVGSTRRSGMLLAGNTQLSRVTVD